SSSACLFVVALLCTTLSHPLALHDALPISFEQAPGGHGQLRQEQEHGAHGHDPLDRRDLPTERGLVGATLGPRLVEHRPHLHRRSEEHTSELQSRENLVCRLLLEKKNTNAP